MASRFSVIDTGRPAARSSCTKPCRTSSIVASTGIATISPPALIASRSLAQCTTGASRPGLVGDELLAGLDDVGLVLEEHVQRLADCLGIDLVAPQVQQRPGPVDRLRHRRGLLEIQRPDRPHDLRDLLSLIHISEPTRRTPISY